LAQYVYPRRKALELAGSQSLDLNVQFAAMLEARRKAREAREQAEAQSAGVLRND
jgi:hypothetical protein